MLRHVSDAFAEDPLRVLRVARFAARLGFLIAPETIKLMREISSSSELRHLTKERVWAELSRAMMERHPQNFFKVLGDVGAMKSLFGNTAAIFERSQHRLMVMVMSDDAISEKQRWMGLFMDITDAALINTFIKDVKMPSEIAKAIRFAVDLVAVDKSSAKDLVGFTNRWKLNVNNLSLLRDAISVFNVVNASIAATMVAMPVAVQKSAAMNLSSLPLAQQKYLEGPAIGAAINEMREGPFNDWIAFKQKERDEVVVEVSSSGDRLLIAAKALATKMDQVTEDISPMFAEMQLVRGRGPYQGATYGEELDELKAAIAESDK